MVSRIHSANGPAFGGFSILDFLSRILFEWVFGQSPPLGLCYSN